MGDINKTVEALRKRSAEERVRAIATPPSFQTRAIAALRRWDQTFHKFIDRRTVKK
jgi:hypothetical protein